MKIATATLEHTTPVDWESVYEPAEDSFLLIDALEADLPFILTKNPSICLEVGCGSGVVITSLATALGTKTFCTATDINPAACKLTRRTANANTAIVDVIEADLIPLRPGSVDLVIFNPPYVPTLPVEVSGSGIERSWAGGYRGRQIVDRFLDLIVPALSSSGLGYLLLLQENAPDEVTDILQKNGCIVKQIAQRKLRGESLLVLRFEKSMSL